MLALVLVPSLASADESVTSQVENRVRERLLKPLAAKENERSKFSRARLPPSERRVRVTQAKTTTDPSGGEYLAFAVDVKWGTTWHENDIVGCAYPKTGTLFVKRGEEFRSADILLGKSADPVAGVCVPAKPKA